MSKYLILNLFILISYFQVSPCYAGEPNINNKIDQLLTDTFPKRQPGAVVLVAKSGKVIFHKAYGMANVEMQIPLTTDMHFRIASLTKQITAMAALKLEQQGKLNFTDQISEHLPSYPVHGNPVTIEHLATNTSGIKNMQEFQGFSKVEREHHSLESLLAYFSDEPFEFQPGEHFSYSSSNFVILGRLIEVKSQLSYMQYLRQSLLQPLGMNNTFYGSNTKILPGRVQGYEYRDGELINAPYLSMTVPHAAGALRSTTMDLYRWQKGLIENTLFSKDEIARAWSKKQLNDNSWSNYGYGWFIGNLDGEKTVSHSGGIPGFSSFAAMIPEKDHHVIILSNNNNQRLDHLAAKLFQLVQGKPSLPDAAIKLSSTLKSSLTGEYYFPDYGVDLTIYKEQGKLLMSNPWLQQPEILHGSEHSQSAYYLDTWTKLKPTEMNSRGDVVIERWTGEQFFGVQK